jgi:Bacteriocin-protection, YdeI or OmpD-Associated/Domain of unknown function (DUF1905)
LPFDTRDVWGKAKVPVRVTINGYTGRSTVGNRSGIQYIVVNADGRRGAGAKAFTHKKEFVVWYSEAKKEDTRTRRVEKMKEMLSAGKVIS